MAEFRLSNFTSGTALTAAELNTGLTYTDYTPTWTQSVAITKTVNWARYTIFGKLVEVSLKMTATSTGTANNRILVGLPVNASSNNFIMGEAVYDDTTNHRALLVSLESTTTVSFIGTESANASNLRAGQTNGPTITIASGAIIYCRFTYEAA